MENQLKSYLEAWDTVGARSLFQEDLNKEEMDLIAWDLVSLISSYMTEATDNQCPILIATCSDLLVQVVDFGSPKELLIGLLENCESFSESVRCLNSLPALSKVLLRLHDKASSWSWTLSTLISHLHSYPPLPSKGLEQEGRLLLENDSDVLLRVKTVESFTDQLIDTLMTQFPLNEEIHNEMATFILNIFHKPLIYLNLHKEEGKEYESRALLVSKRLLNYLITLVPNPFSLLNLYEKLMFRLKEVEGRTAFENSRFTQQSIATVFYLIFGENVRKDILPQVYTPLHVFKTVLPFITIFLNELNEMAVFKGLILFNKLTESLSTLSMEVEDIQFEKNREFLQSLVKVIVYHDLREYRTLAYTNYNLYYGLFSPKARLIFFKTIIHLSNHSGLIGDAITKWKDTVLWNLEKNAPLSEYTGESLRQIIKKVCQLSHGAETDLLEVSDELQSIINALYAVFTRDKDNISGIWELSGDLKEGFIGPLHEGLIISKEHYKLKLRNEESSEKPEVSLMVGGQALPQMSKNELKSFVHSAICAFEMIELSLSRLEDAIESKK